MRCSINWTADGQWGFTGGPASSWKLRAVPREWESGPGEMGESLAPCREHSAPVSSPWAGRPVLRAGSKREERAGCIFPSFCILCLPFSLCRAGLSLPAPPSCLTLCVCVSVCLSCFLYVPSSTILLKSYPPGTRIILGIGF